MEVALEAGANDVMTDDDGAIEVLCAAPDFEAVKNAHPAEADQRGENSSFRIHHRSLLTSLVKSPSADLR
jgi:transcriptional/translational regulatory protein YebC/TACO1